MIGAEHQMFNKKVILEQAKTYNSFYLYDEAKIIEYSNKLKEDFENVDFLYSIKANPHPMIVDTIVSQGFGADAASLNEVKLTSKHGMKKEEIYYSTPGKTLVDIEESMDISIIIADSINEVLKIQEVAQKKGVVAKIGIRINPDFTYTSDKGVSSKFGIDEEIVFENCDMFKELKNIEITGIHVHIRSQELETELIKNYYKNILALAERVKENLGIDLEFINLGSGIGIPYSQEDKAVDTEYLGNAATEMFKSFKEKMPNTKMFIETGRFVVTKSGVYATKVLDIKESYGSKYIVLTNTLNGFIKAPIAQFALSSSKEEYPTPWEPMYTGRDSFQIIALTDEKEEEKVTLGGNLCTATDMVAKDIMMPKLKLDDVVVMTNAGSYAAVITPMQFASLKPPAQLFLTLEGEVVDISK